MEKIAEHDLINAEHSYSYLIKKDNEEIGEFLLKDEYIHISIFDKIPDINTQIYIYFKSISYKNHDNYISYFYMSTSANHYFKLNNNSLSLDFDEILKSCLHEIYLIFADINRDLKIDNDIKLEEEYSIIFDKDVWIFMKNKDKRKRKLNQLNI